MSAITCHHRFRPLLCFLFLCGLCLVVPAPVGAVEYGDELTDDFNGGIDFNHWKVISNQPLFRFDDSSGDVLMSKPYGGRGWGYHDIASLCFKGHVVGAFDVSVDFSGASLAVADTGCNTASLDLLFGGQMLNLVRQECEEGGDTVGVWLEPQEFWAGFEVADTGGVLRVTRDQANVVTAYFNEIPFYNEAFNGAAVTELCLSLGNHLSLDPISVRFDDFAVSAGSIDYPDLEWREVIAAPAVDCQGNTAIAFNQQEPEAAIAYTDPATDEVRVVRGVRNGPVWSWAQPEVAAEEGRAVEVAYDSCGRLWVSYLSGPSTKGGLLVVGAVQLAVDRDHAPCQAERFRVAGPATLSEGVHQCAQHLGHAGRGRTALPFGLAQKVSGATLRLVEITVADEASDTGDLAAGSCHLHHVWGLLGSVRRAHLCPEKGGDRHESRACQQRDRSSAAGTHHAPADL